MERSCKMFPTYFSSVQQYTWGMIMLIKYKTIRGCVKTDTSSFYIDS